VRSVIADISSARDIIAPDDGSERYNRPVLIYLTMDSDQWIAIILVVLMVVSGVATGAVALL
jgi:hypothetical protein